MSSVTVTRSAARCFGINVNNWVLRGQYANCHSSISCSHHIFIKQVLITTILSSYFATHHRFASQHPSSEAIIRNPSLPTRGLIPGMAPRSHLCYSCIASWLSILRLTSCRKFPCHSRFLSERTSWRKLRIWGRFDHRSGDQGAGAPQ